MRFQRLFAIAVFSASTVVPGLLASDRAEAATATSTLDVATTVTANCAVTAGSLVLSGFTETGGATGAGSFGVTCTNESGYTIALDAGTGAGATVAARVLTGAADATKTLTYGLYSDAAFATLWGDGTGGSAPVAGTGTGQLQTVPVYGKIFGGQFPTAQSYTDTVVITVNY
jgi:spore coat protein U-like protein